MKTKTKKQKELDKLSKELSENHDNLKNLEIMKTKKQRDILFTSKHNDKKRVLYVDKEENKEIPILNLDDDVDMSERDNPFNN